MHSYIWINQAWVLHLEYVKIPVIHKGFLTSLSSLLCCPQVRSQVSDVQKFLIGLYDYPFWTAECTTPVTYKESFKTLNIFHGGCWFISGMCLTINRTLHLQRDGKRIISSTGQSYISNQWNSYVPMGRQWKSLGFP